jgi:hypothetical protein
MPDIIKELDALYGESSYDSPLVRIDEWRIFMDQFIPAASNTALVAKVFAWSPNSDNHYFAIPGLDGTFKYTKGCDLTGVVDVNLCRINKQMFLLNGDFKTLVGEEILKSVSDLAAFVCAAEGNLLNPLEARPLTLKDIQGGERILWDGESRGLRLRILRQDDGLISLQAEDNFGKYGSHGWNTLWPA